MYNANYYFTRLLVSPFFSFLPFLLGVCLLVVFKNFESAYFCDGESTEELKNRLNDETIKYKEAINKYGYYVDLFQQAINRPERHYEIEFYLMNKKSDTLGLIRNSLTKICAIETDIKRTNPLFKSIIIDLKDYYDLKVSTKI
jgi:hypothetical protein